MTNYYFLGTLLPELQLDEVPEIGFAELIQLLKENLSEKDFEKTLMIRNYYDIFNLRSSWKERPFDLAGNLDESELEEALVTRTLLPDFVFSFLEKHETNKERLHHFPELLATFFHEAIEQALGKLKAFFALERDLRLVLMSFRAKKLNRDLLPELQYENPEDEFVAQIIATSNTSKFEPPEKYEELKELFLENYDDPLALQKALLEYRIRKIEEFLGADLFSIDRILGYMLELIMIEKWQTLDKEKGLEIVDSMLKEPL